MNFWRKNRLNAGSKRLHILLYSVAASLGFASEVKCEMAPLRPNTYDTMDLYENKCKQECLQSKSYHPHNILTTETFTTERKKNFLNFYEQRDRQTDKPD